VKPSFSLKWLLIGAVVMGLTFTALLNANGLWVCIAFATVILLLVGATVRSHLLFLRGFSIAGWAYFALTLAPMVLPVEDWFLTTQLGLLVPPKLTAICVEWLRGNEQWSFYTLMISLFLWTVIFGLIGGFVAQWFGRNNKAVAKSRDKAHFLA